MCSIAVKIKCTFELLFKSHKQLSPAPVVNLIDTDTFSSWKELNLAFAQYAQEKSKKRYHFTVYPIV